MEPKDLRTLYAGTNGSGLYRSTDAGERWTGVPLKAADARSWPPPILCLRPCASVAIVSVNEHTVSFIRHDRPTAAQSDLVLTLREEFRSHLETFYSRLKLAPPYESVEKAIRSLTTAVHGLPNAQRARLAQDPGEWDQFRQAFETSDSPRNIAASLQAWRGTERVSGCPQSTTIF